MSAGMTELGFAEWRAGRAEARFSDWLAARAEPHWSAAVGHRFTRELADDSLPDDAYRRYLVQDYAFLDVLVRVVALAVAYAPDMPPKSKLSAFLAAVTSEENDYFLRSFAALDVDAESLAETRLGPTTRAFREIMLGAARDGSYEEILAVLLPAEWCYLTWAQAVAGQKPGRFYLREWIELHSIPEFEAFVAWLRAEMDERAADLPEERQEGLADLFGAMMELEVAFFEEAYEE